MNKFFEPQNLIFDITLCGGSLPLVCLNCYLETLNCTVDFAGPDNIFSATCSGKCYPDHVVGNGSNYATAYFEVGSVRVFGNVLSSGNDTGSGGNSSMGEISSGGGKNGGSSMIYAGLWSWALGLSVVALLV